MRTLVLVVTLIVLSPASSVTAQVLEGPLVTPGASAPAQHPSAHRTKVATISKRTLVSKAARLPAVDSSATPGRAAPDPIARKPAPATEPISLGMKWNGTNENGRETRFDNLNGGAAGTGGEVGLKLHF